MCIKAQELLWSAARELLWLSRRRGRPTHTTKSRRYDHFFCHFLRCWETANSWQPRPQWHQQHMMEDSVWKWKRSNRGGEIGKRQEKGWGGGGGWGGGDEQEIVLASPLARPSSPCVHEAMANKWVSTSHWSALSVSFLLYVLRGSFIEQRF